MTLLSSFSERAHVVMPTYLKPFIKAMGRLGQNRAERGQLQKDGSLYLSRILCYRTADEEELPTLAGLAFIYCKAGRKSGRQELRQK